MHSLLSKYHHKTDIHVRFQDIDAVGHVNNARYASYLEEARIAYAREVLGWNGKLEDLNIVVADLHLEFKNPVHLSDGLQIFSRVSEVGGRSFTFEYVMMVQAQKNPDEPVLAAKAATRLVYYDYASRKSSRIPEHWRAAIYEFENEI